MTTSRSDEKEEIDIIDAYEELYVEMEAERAQLDEDEPRVVNIEGTAYPKEDS